ncbi:hypothetical protein ACHAXH_005460 [Discostella pseudostelligera]
MAMTMTNDDPPLPLLTTMTTRILHDDPMTSTSVLYVRKRDAKIIKALLENAALLDKRYRMTTVSLLVGGEENISDGDHPVVEVTWCHHDAAADHDCKSNIACSQLDGNYGNADERMQTCIAVPVTEACVESFHRHRQHHNMTSIIMDKSNPNSAEDSDNIDPNKRSIISNIKMGPCDDKDVFRTEETYRRIIGFGRCECPYSSSMLGNNNFIKSRRCRDGESANHSNHSVCLIKLSCSTADNNHRPSCSSIEDCVSDPPLTNIQHILIETLTNWLRKEGNSDANTSIANNELRSHHTFAAVELARALSIQSCPRKLEVIGDDRTLVIPRWSFFIVSNTDDSTEGENATTSYRTKQMQQEKERRDFRELLLRLIGSRHDENNDVDNLDDNAAMMCEIQSQLWTNLATSFNCSRIVRRGDVDPDSGIRESGHRIVWPIPDEISLMVCNCGYTPTETGVDSPGWITVTEHKITQSFDITRVMFSRGNVTEKKRFGMSLVQSGENILDMYAGIGYYTLPALIHGKARHVTACEWNEHALFALRRNLRANGIPEGDVTVLEGDCRVSLKRLLDREGTSSTNSECNEVKQWYQFDRISLGLLPSSEGGWAIAVSCLHKTTGGWLHVHGNVATAERDNWAHWLCDTLAQYALPNGHDGWIAVCTHVEKVKSFAPKVDHVVADVFVGPPTSSKLQGSWSEKTTGVFDSVGRFMPTSSVNISTPSCALNEDGILNQSWMRE